MNQISYLIDLEATVRPYFFTPFIWKEVVVILQYYRILARGRILSQKYLEDIADRINVQINIIYENSISDEIDEVNNYIIDVLDYYIVKAEDIEIYEICSNFSKLKNILSNQISIMNNP